MMHENVAPRHIPVAPAHGHVAPTKPAADDFIPEVNTPPQHSPDNCRCSGYRGIPVHLLLGPFNGPTSAQGRNDDQSSAEKTLMRRRLMRRTTAKWLRTRRPPHELFLVRGRTTSTSAQHVSVLSKKIRAEDYVPSTLPLTGRRPTFAMPA
jgi:hypothetical protein